MITSEVSDAEDPRLADYIGLTDPDLRRRTEAEGGFFIVEGLLPIERLISLGTWPIRSVLVTEKARARLALDLLTDDVPVLVASPRVLRATVGFDLHRGAVASVDRCAPWPDDPAELLAGARRVALLEGMNDHENLGALFRNAAAFGVEAVLLDPTCADPLYRRSVRVSIGHVLSVPFARAERPLEVAGEAGLTTVALTPALAADDIADLAADPPERLAWVLGAEGPGLSASALQQADRLVRIPVAPGVDSVNVATAAALAFWAV